MFSNCSRLSNALSRQGFHKPTNIQKLALNALSATPTRQLTAFMIGAHTGSGKTLAYGIPLLQTEGGSLVIVPSRELMTQTQQMLAPLAADMEVDCEMVGRNQVLKMKPKKVSIAMPNLVSNKENRKRLMKQMKHLDYVVFDEADYTISASGLEKFSETILELIKYENRRRKNEKDERPLKVVMAGATLPTNGKRTLGGIMKRRFKGYQEILCPSLHSVPEKLSQKFLPITLPKASDQHATEVTARVCHLVQQIYETNRDSKLIIFGNSNSFLEGLAKSLRKKLGSGIGIGALCKTVSSEERQEYVEVFNNRENGKQDISILLCTDLGARGIDFNNVDCVIQAQFATCAQTYLHRVGRTARNGVKGSCISFYAPDDEDLLKAIQQNLEEGSLEVTTFSRNRRFRKRLRKHRKKELNQVEESDDSSISEMEEGDQDQQNQLSVSENCMT